MSAMTLPVLSSENGLQQYLREVRSFPMLSPEEEFMCAKRWREHGDSDAAPRLVTSHLRLVVKIARRYRGFPLSFLDIVSEGNIGLMKAVQRFDPDKGYRLATYAMWWIRAEIMEFILKSWSLVRVGPANLQKRIFYGLRKAKARLNMMDDEALSTEQAQALAKQMGVAAEDVSSLSSRMARRDLSLNQPLADDDSGDEFIDRLRDERPSPESVYAEVEEEDWRRRVLARAMADLPERDREIVSARWLGDTSQTLEELGVRFGISRERVRQIEERALKKIRETVERLSLEASSPASATV